MRENPPEARVKSHLARHHYPMSEAAYSAKPYISDRLRVRLIQMILRDLGRTGVKVSEMGLGTEYLKRASKETVVSAVDRAIENGVNYFDILFNLQSYVENLSATFKGRRDKVVLSSHLGSAERNGQYFKTRSVRKCEEILSNTLSRLGTDYVDIANVHYVKDMKEYEEIAKTGGVLDLAHRLKREGKARFVGISTHDVTVVQKAARSG